ncbi:hypothetical protein SAMN04489867_2130 [Pedococcus dokdonensis]|uniref:Uncharacterized protein n=1 Tax=Pedococcus dokdonensis TaxID=443156 RepID=A0A1H0RZE9_9MICO|nr:hypothetical protein [Pedococcus dokdonensis]SDP34328.1 hypothetical protein SAMN04489867_2130 [Pedococcus dokdonensis]
MSDAEREKSERAERAAYHVEADRKRRERESAKAQVLVDQFVRDAVAAGIATTELTARPYSGRGRYRTGLQGWFLRPDLSVGVDVDGGYHPLVVSPERWGRWRGVTLTPSPPPLQVGEGARDGESIALDALLQRRLDAGNGFA